METIKSITKKINTTLSRSNIEENLFSFTVPVWRRVDGVSGRWWGSELLLFGRVFFFFFFSVFFFTTMLTACVFVTRETVRHPRRFVFGKFVRKPNCSWSEEFVSRGLTVLRKGKNDTNNAEKKIQVWYGFFQYFRTFFFVINEKYKRLNVTVSYLMHAQILKHVNISLYNIFLTLKTQYILHKYCLCFPTDSQYECSLLQCQWVHSNRDNVVCLLRGEF